MVNFICGGLLGDFIQCLFAVKQLSKIRSEKVNLYITDNISFGGDRFKYPIEVVYSELQPIILQQDYIKTFQIYNNQTNELINLNNFRKSPLLYQNNWTEFLQHTFNFTFTPPYSWIKIDEINPFFNDKILIHRSLKTQRHCPHFPFKKIIDKYQNQLVFISNDPNEYETFPYKSQIPYHRVENLYEMYVAINSCKFFVGNQSSPYTIATSLDKLRVLELGDSLDRNSSIGEEKYSSNILDVSNII